MNKRHFRTVLAIVIPMTAILVVLGLIFNKTDLEKINGFTSLFAISKDNQIAYVYHNEGKSEIYLHNNETDPLVILDAEKVVTDIVFSPNSSSLIYVVNDMNIDDASKLISIVYELKLSSKQQTELFRENKIITEITFDPKDENKLFYLGAATFENYSPIVRAAPHDFDIYSYSFTSEELNRHTTFEKYNITSLQISNTEHIAYVQMADDFQAETADDLFAMQQKIFEIPLTDPENWHIISDSNATEDIYDMLYMPEHNTIIYQAVSQTSTDGIFEYELFSFNMDEQKSEQLTYLKQYTAQPFYSAHDDKVYFIVDKQFAKQFSDYYLYRMDFDGSNVEELKLK